MLELSQEPDRKDAGDVAEAAAGRMTSFSVFVALGLETQEPNPRLWVRDF